MSFELSRRTDFHAHHSPPGAYASFTCGRHGAGGGFSIEGRQPAQQNLIIGFIDADGHTQALPFFTNAGADLSSFVEGMQAGGVSRRPFTDLRRLYAASSDRWHSGEFTFSLYTPVEGLPDPVTEPAALLECLLPAIVGELTYDNRRGERDVTLVICLEGAGAPRLHRDGATQQVVFGREWGLAAAAPAEGFCQWSEWDYWHEGRSHLLGGTGGFCLRVPSGSIGSLPLVFGFYRGGTVTTGREGRFYYTRGYASLTDVLSRGLQRFERRRERALDQDARLMSSRLSAEQAWLVAHATRSYWGNTQLLDLGGEPCWVVLEGEYGMINTFDLAVDQCFYEVQRNPWVVRNLLDQFVEHYSFHDTLQRPPAPSGRGSERPVDCRDPGRLHELVPPPIERGLPGGISFTHDMGTHGHFSPPGTSSYELSRLTGCFSHMTGEQLLNWICTATSYYRASGDIDWLRRRAPILQACLQSLLNRDDPDPSRRDGIQGLDSERCDGGWEITTYDSLDPSLGQARGNTYMAVKAWAAALGLQCCLLDLGLPVLAETASKQAQATAARVCAGLAGRGGHLPALLDGSCDTAIIPAIEGLVFPLVWGLREALAPEGAYGPLLRTLKEHHQAVLQPGRCLFADGGWKLSASAENSWLSKIFLCQHVAERVFGLPPAEASHRAHVDWQIDGAPDTAFSDQCVSGVARGSKYYPRGVTCDLWLQATPLASGLG